jgi:hypothetical protein
MPRLFRTECPSISQTGGVDKADLRPCAATASESFLAVLFRVLPCCIVLVLGSLQVMTEGNPGMMRGLLVVASFVMLGGFTMMFGSVFVMLRCLFVMLVNLVLCHETMRAPRTFSAECVDVAASIGVARTCSNSGMIGGLCDQRGSGEPRTDGVAIR